MTTETRQVLLAKIAQLQSELAATKSRVAEREASPFVGEPYPNTNLVSESFDRTLGNLSEGCETIGFDWRYVYINEAAARNGQRPRGELLGRKMMECYPGIEKTAMFELLQHSMQHRTTERIENEVTYPNGTKAWFDLRIQPVPEGIFILSVDITERKQAETRIRTLNRTLAVRGDINQAIVRNRHLPTLFERACMIAVEKGAFRMAWIGLLEPTTGRVRPVAYAGVTGDYIEKLTIVVDDDLRGGGPAGRAIRTRQHVICNNIETDPRLVPWREDALRLGYQSTAACPLTIAEEVKGILNLYSDASDFFNDEETRLLDEMAMDISFAMAVAEQEVQRRTAENAVENYAHRLEILHEIGLGIIEAVSIHSVVEAALKDIQLIIPCQRASVALYDPAEQTLTIYALNLNKPSPLNEGARIPIPSGVFDGFDAEHTRIIDDFRIIQDQTPTYKQLVKDGLLSAVQVLLMSQGQPTGIFSLLADTPGYFTTEHREFAVQVADQLTVAIRQLHQTEALANHAVELQHSVIARTADLTENKERVEAILNNSSDGILLMHVDFTIQQTNSAFNRLFACDPDEYFGKPLLSFMHVEDFDLVTWAIQAAIPQRQNKTIEVRARRKDGSVFDAELSLGFFKNDSVVGTIRDITERKAQERQLRYQASLQENVSDAVMVTDLDFHIQSWNRAAERIYGWRIDEVINKTTAEVLRTQFSSPNDLNLSFRQLQEQGWWQGEVIQLHKDGGTRHILGSVTLLKDENGRAFSIVSVNHDITERKRIEAALNAQTDEEREFQGYLRAIHEITFELAQIDRLDEFYKRTVELGLQRLGIDRLSLFVYDRENNIAIGTYGTDTRGKLVDEHDLRFVPGQDDIMRRALRHAEHFYLEENVPLFGSQRETLGTGWHAAAILWNGTQSLGWLVADNLLSHKPASKSVLNSMALYALSVGTLLARKQAEEALRDQRDFLQLVIDSVPALIVVKDRELQFQLVNNLAAQIYDASTAELVGKTDADVNPDQNDVRTIQQKDREALATGQTVHLPEEAIGGRYYQTSKIPLQNRAGQFDRLLVVGSDVTEHKMAEESLQLAVEKERELNDLKSRFLLTASHEFRTPLAAIRAVADTLSIYRSRMTENQIDQKLSKITEQVDRLRDIMDDVLQLARMQARRVEFNPEFIDLDKLCRSVIDEFQDRADIHHRFVYVSEKFNHNIQLDKKLIRQILSNLFSNAIKYSLPDKSILIQLECTTEIALLKVSDQGIGIPESDLKHLFEPFHRATNVGTIAGTGLGLVITKDAVEMHGGTIGVESQSNIGTTFTIRLPVKFEKENNNQEDLRY